MSVVETAKIFDFALSASGLVSVANPARDLRWDFVVETANGRRFLQPLKTRMSAIDRRSTSALRREAFEFAVVQARSRDVID